MCVCVRAKGTIVHSYSHEFASMLMYALHVFCNIYTGEEIDIRSSENVYHWVKMSPATGVQNSTLLTAFS